MRIDTILERYRRPAAVPEVVADELAGELAPVFAALDELAGEAERIRADARRRAQSRLQAARDQAVAVLGDAAAQAETERAEAAAAGREASQVMMDELLAASEAEAARTRELAGDRIPGLVAAVLACVEGAP
jgi:hypothetical protein